MLTSLPDASAACIIADPPWLYSGGQEAGHTGLAGHHSKGLPDKVIAAHLALTYRVAAPDSYLMIWATFPKLLGWAREDAIPPYVVFHDATLAEIAARRPSSLGELSQIAGVGPTKLERYGDDVLAALAAA